MRKVSRTPTHISWEAMLSRCRRDSDKCYHLYGGRGIRVCERWGTFEYFLEDMGERPNGKSLDRIDGNKGYYKENCRWATNVEQARNKCNNVRYPYEGKMLLVSEIFEEEYGKWCLPCVSLLAASTRLYRGWAVHEALYSKIGSYKPNHENRKEDYFVFWGNRVSIKTAFDIYSDKIPNGVSRNAVYRRIKKGWSPEAALTTPNHKGKKLCVTM